MKKLIFGALLLLGICSSKLSSFKEDLKALSAENRDLSDKIEKFCQETNSRLKSISAKADRLARSASDPNTLVPVYKENCDYLNSVQEKIQELEKSLKDQSDHISRTGKEMDADSGLSDNDREGGDKSLQELVAANDKSKINIREVSKNCRKLKKISCREMERMKKLAK